MVFSVRLASATNGAGAVQSADAMKKYTVVNVVTAIWFEFKYTDFDTVKKKYRFWKENTRKCPVVLMTTGLFAFPLFLIAFLTPIEHLTACETACKSICHALFSPNIKITLYFRRHLYVCVTISTLIVFFNSVSIVKEDIFKNKILNTHN